MIIEVSKLHTRETLESNTAPEQTRQKKALFTVLFCHRASLEIVSDSG